jgi:hypothetical protein
LQHVRHLGLVHIVCHSLWRAKKQNQTRVTYWEIIANNLSKAGWTWGVSQLWILAGERSIADAHRDDGKRFVAHADEKLTAFLELELVIRAITLEKVTS